MYSSLLIRPVSPPVNRSLAIREMATYTYLHKACVLCYLLLFTANLAISARVLLNCLLVTFISFLTQFLRLDFAT